VFAAGASITVSATFSEPIAPATLTDATFQLLSAGPDDIFGTTDDAAVADGIVSYRTESNTALLSFVAPLPPALYRAAIATDVTDLAGNPLAAEFVWPFRVFFANLAEGGSFSVSGSLNTPGAQDTFGFNAAPGQMAYFNELSGDTCTSAVRWKALDDGGTVIFNEQLGGHVVGCPGGSVGIRALERGGAYTITVFGLATAAGPYQFTVSNVPPPDRFTIGVGNRVSNNVPGRGAGNIETAGAQDIYTFSATAEQVVFFDLQQATPDFRWRCVDADGAEVFARSSTFALRTLTRDGAYTITVDFDADATGKYQFQLWDVPPPDQFTISIGEQVSDGVPDIGAGNIETPSRQDVYTFTAAPGQEVYFDIQLGGFEWTFADDHGSVIFGPTFEDQLQTLSGGDYTLTVMFLGAATGTYQFQLCIPIGIGCVSAGGPSATGAQSGVAPPGVVVHSP